MTLINHAKPACTMQMAGMSWRCTVLDQRCRCVLFRFIALCAWNYLDTYCCAYKSIVMKTNQAVNQRKLRRMHLVTMQCEEIGSVMSGPSRVKLEHSPRRRRRREASWDARAELTIVVLRLTRSPRGIQRAYCQRARLRNELLTGKKRINFEEKWMKPNLN